jgi:hypothetical protein
MSDSTIETYEYGITRQWLDGGRIAQITTQGDMTRGAVDQWAELVIDTVRTWPDDGPIFLLEDLSHRYQGFTHYARQRAEDTYRSLKEGQRGYLALILRHSIIMQIISLFLRRRPPGPGIIEERIFTSYDEALRWLRERVAEEAQSRV